MTLSVEQRDRAIEVMRAYLAAPPVSEGRSPVEIESELDRNRAELIDTQLNPLVRSYLTGETPLSDFKSRVDSINKQHQYWGFKGIKGQMFFNMVVNVAHDLAECDQELKAAIAIPANEDMARSRIRTFASYVRRIGDAHVEAGGTKYGRPKGGSIPFFLSYFWQLQDRHTWPVFYTNSVNTMIDLNLFRLTDDLADDYVHFKHIHEQLEQVFTEASGRSFGLYEVEHVFWFRGGNEYDAPLAIANEENGQHQGRTPPAPIESALTTRLPDSFLPPIVAILPQIARNEPGLDALARASGTSLSRAFEKSIDAAFTIIGYDEKLMGQGTGRVPDGLALDVEDSYALLWDGKMREVAYSMGTDDRAIREYITTQCRNLKRRHSLRNVYYIVISSGFVDDCDDVIRSIKMETEVSEVCLLEAAALVAIVDAKLRSPLQVPLGPDGIQRLFSSSGIITVEDVMRNLLG
jgi:hypothetical protein